MRLSDVQARVLGSLVEKEIATPENYPLSLNALRNACNQSSSREPVMTLGEEEIRQALHVLQDLALAEPASDGRVAKFEHRLRDRLQLRRDEVAVLCLLLLRGPQTPGELRSRADRLYVFDGTDAVLTTLQRLAARIAPEFPEGALTQQLARQPGARESRWVQTLTDVSEAAAFPTTQTTATHDSSHAGDLLAQISELRRELDELRRRVDHLEGR